MRFLDKDNSDFYSNTLPQGPASEPDLIEAYRKALDRQADASQAWVDLLNKHIEDGSQWSAVLHSAFASGMTTEELRARLGASPSTISRWFDGLVQPSRMLRARLEKELMDFVGTIVERLRKASSKLPKSKPALVREWLQREGITPGSSVRRVSSSGVQSDAILVDRQNRERAAGEEGTHSPQLWGP